MSTWNESVRKLTKVSVALRKPLAKAGNGARQGKMRIKVYLKKREKRWKCLHATINMRLDIIDRNGLKFKPKRWPKTRHVLFVTCVIILSTPQPPSSAFFLLAITSIQHGYHLSCVMNIQHGGGDAELVSNPSIQPVKLHRLHHWSSAWCLKGNKCYPCVFTHNISFHIRMLFCSNFVGKKADLEGWIGSWNESSFALCSYFNSRLECAEHCSIMQWSGCGLHSACECTHARAFNPRCNKRDIYVAFNEM